MRWMADRHGCELEREWGCVAKQQNLTELPAAAVAEAAPEAPAAAAAAAALPARMQQ